MRPALLLAALLQATALGPTTVPCSNKDVANGIRDGLQSALRSRKSRLAVELPPGAPLALRGGDDDAHMRRAAKARIQSDGRHGRARDHGRRSRRARETHSARVLQLTRRHAGSNPILCDLPCCCWVSKGSTHTQAINVALGTENADQLCATRLEHPQEGVRGQPG